MNDEQKRTELEYKREKASLAAQENMGCTVGFIVVAVCAAASSIMYYAISEGEGLVGAIAVVALAAMAAAAAFALMKFR